MASRNTGALDATKVTVITRPTTAASIRLRLLMIRLRTIVRIETRLTVAWP